VAGSAVVSLIGAVLLLVIELIATMLIYSYLNLSHVDTFGWLVRQADTVRTLLVSQLELWLPASSNAAYATLIGELGPKAILLLMIGLVVGSVLRWTLALFRG
jgi:hypothetical protein